MARGAGMAFLVGLIFQLNLAFALTLHGFWHTGVCKEAAKRQQQLQGLFGYGLEKN